MENALEYKERWTSELVRRKAHCVVEPDPIPHPADIMIDMHTGRVRTEGPLNEQEEARWDERLARRSEAQPKSQHRFCAIGADGGTDYAHGFLEAAVSYAARTNGSAAGPLSI